MVVRLSVDGEELRRRRLRLALTTEELAAKASLSAGTVRQYETGLRSGARVQSIRKLADALGCRYKDLAVLEEVEPDRYG